MDVTPLIPAGRQIIQSYGATGFKISGIRYEDAVMVTPEKTWVWTGKPSVQDLSAADFTDYLPPGNAYDVYLLGTGKTSTFLPAPLLRDLKSRQIHPDVMESGAACRTYNVLMAEGRRVVAFLLRPLAS
ncbi:MAG: Mth938-like domain-containing protein [Rhodospirillales bacterium]|nr:Mth938-like domain-containing protein [Rhodospirillales bacterium]MCB9965635.1 Mth938-like domain-containing protein [Rhodospirillales bacterium]MCB9973059.1 Mth938-like domain-containing protein [Rhodospirillales bacterium]